MKIPIMNSEIKFNKDENAATIYGMKVYNNIPGEIWTYFTQKELLDQWWAPEPWKCETSEINFEPNGRWTYAMISPENDKYFGNVRFHEINQGRSFDWTKSFTDEQGNLNINLPSSNWLLGFTGVDEGTKLTINIHFKSPQEMKQLCEMGFEEEFKTRLNQLETLLNEKD